MIQFLTMSASFKEKLFYYISIFSLCLFVFSFLYHVDYSFDQDLGRHLKLGELIVKTGQIPYTNLFSYTNPNFPFINHHYLFEVFIYLFGQSLPLNLLLFLKIIIVLTAVLLILLITYQFSPTALFLPVSFIFLHVLRERTDLRPEIFSFLLTALTLYFLERIDHLKKIDKTVWILPFIQLLWVNTHIYFLIGLILQTIYLIWFYLTKDRQFFSRLLIIFILSLLATLVNPNYLKGALYPLQVFNNYGYTIAENQNLFLMETLGVNNPNYLFVKISSLIVVLSIIVALIRKKLLLKNLLLSLLGLILALAHIRSFPYLIFISLPATLANFGPVKINKITLIINFIFLFLLFSEAINYLNGQYYLKTNNTKAAGLSFQEHGQGAVDFLLDHQLPQPIFNNFDIGSYIIYRMFPKYQVFVDGRPEAYPQDFFQKVYIPAQENPAVFAELDQKYHFQTIIFSHTDQTPWAETFLQEIVKNPHWRIVYFDDFMIILVRDEVAQKLQLAVLNLNNWPFNSLKFTTPVSFAKTALFLFNNQATASAIQVTEAGWKQYPQSPILNLLMSAIVQSNLLPYQENSQNKIWW